MSLRAYLETAREREASSLYLGAGSIPCARIEGEFVRLGDEPLTPVMAAALSEETAARTDGAVVDADAEFCFDEEGLGRFRVNLHRHQRGAGISLKCVPMEARTLNELGLPEDLYDLTRFRTGMVLAAGPAGCGKSSTLAALLRRINETRRLHVVTIEDPIEFVYRSDKANITQRQVGRHTRSFAAALRASLREDPDVILVSELRDPETIHTAIVAAETGHLVLGTLHTSDAASTVRRLVDVFPAREREQVRTMVSDSLRAVVCQHLLPRAGGGVRVPSYEILRVTPAVATQIRDDRTHQIPSLLQIGRKYGMVDRDTRVQELLDAGLITAATARTHAKNRARFGTGGAGGGQAGD